MPARRGQALLRAQVIARRRRAVRGLRELVVRVVQAGLLRGDGHLRLALELDEVPLGLPGSATSIRILVEIRVL